MNHVHARNAKGLGADMATEKVELDQISDEELFDGDEKPEAAEAEPEAQETEPEAAEAKEGTERDEKGRFVKKAEKEPEPDESPEEPEAEAEPEQEPESEDRQAIPSWRLKEEADARREWQQKAEAEAQARAQLEQRLRQIEQNMRQQEQPQAEPIDPFQDPEGWAQAQSQTVEQKIRAMEGNFSLRLAKAVHKDVFDEAWSEMISRSQGGDDAMRQQVLNSSDPGETLVALYRQAKTFKEVNGDPNAWLEAKKAEWLQDPEVQKQILELTRETATQNPQSKPQVKLPPSLNKATSSGNQSDRRGSMSDAELWHDTL